MIRERDNFVHNPQNSLEFIEFNRKNRVYRYNNWMIIYEYNAYAEAKGYFFDIQIKKVRMNGKLSSVENFLKQYKIKRDELQRSYYLYFKILEEVLKEEREPLFKHNGRFEDYFSWKEEFRNLGLSENNFEQDVMMLLQRMSKKVHCFD